jgi:DNA repair exonuclease SbcCD nuclease subunit
MINVIFTDTHFGWKNNSMTWLNSQMDFIYKQFIPEIKRLSNHESVRVIHCGDVFDSRSTISTYVATKVVQAFKDIRSVCEEFIIVCGNHDFYSPNSDTVNTVKLFMSNMDIKIVDTKLYETRDYAFVPWYVWNEGNFETDANYVFTHTDLIHDPIPDSCRDKMIMSGHIHTPQYREHLSRYNLGSCYSLNFADANQKRGYYILKQGQLSFEPNKVSINFYRFYNEEILNINLNSLDVNDYIELYVSETNMSKEDYINAIKGFTERFSHLWIIPQVVEYSGQIDEDFKGYDIEAIMENSIPNDLITFYNKIKDKISTSL